MQSLSLKAALAAAEKEAPTSGPKEWETGEYVLEVVASNVNTQWAAPRIGLQLQREDGRRRWFDLYFDETNPKAYAMTGRKLKNLGLSDLIDQLDDLYPENLNAQLQAIADALVGTVFNGKVEKRESNKNTPGTPEDQKKYLNYFDVIGRVTASEASALVAAPAAGLGGLGGLMG